MREPVLYITSTMVWDGIFYILPSSDLGPENPRHLPREILIDGSSTLPELDSEAPRKKGRPSRRDKAKKARVALETLNSWLDSTSSSPSSVSNDIPIPQRDLAQYQMDKAELIAALRDSGDQDAVTKANMLILERLREAQAAETESDGQGGRRFGGVERVERAVQELGNGREGGSGVLGLLEGWGMAE